MINAHVLLLRVAAVMLNGIACFNPPTRSVGARWLVGPNEQCDLAVCYWPAVFSLRRCREQSFACSNDSSGCVQRAWARTYGAFGGVSSEWQSLVQPSFMILLPPNGNGDLVPPLPDGARYEGKLRFGNVTDLTRSLIPVALMAGVPALELPELFKGILQQPMFKREAAIRQQNIRALDENNQQTRVAWHQDTMHVQLANNATKSQWLEGMLNEQNAVQISLALGYSFGLGLGDVMHLTRQIITAICARPESLLARRSRTGVAACVQAKLNGTERFATLWNRPEIISMALHEALADIVQLECLKAHWLRDQALYVKHHLQGSISIAFTRQAAFSDEGNQLLRIVKELTPARGVLLEFGVNAGHSLRIIADRFPNRLVHGFDSFKGLPEKWALGYDKGFFDQKGILPTVPSNVQLHVGWFNETVGPVMQALATEDPTLAVAFAHLDCDLYSSTRDALQQIKPWLRAGSLLLFDEFFGYAEWRQHEYKAWVELATPEKLNYRFVAHTVHPFHDEFSKVLIQLLP